MNISLSVYYLDPIEAVISLISLSPRYCDSPFQCGTYVVILSCYWCYFHNCAILLVFDKTWLISALQCRLALRGVEQDYGFDSELRPWSFSEIAQIFCTT